MLKLQTLSVSAYIRPHMDRVETWTKNLAMMNTMHTAWLETQSKWVYLAPLFSTSIIMEQMANEGYAFQEVDVLWRQLVRRRRAVRLSSANPKASKVFCNEARFGAGGQFPAVFEF